jgi:hypothetical protein
MVLGCWILGFRRSFSLPNEKQSMKEVGCFLILFAPYVWETIDDRKGDLNKKVDVLWRVLIGATASILVWQLTYHSLIGCAFMCFAIFFLLFDYTIATVLGRPDPFSYMGYKGVIDNISFWRKMNPWTRFAVRFTIFAVALIIYI